MSSGMKKALIVAACIAAVGLLLIGISFIVGNRGSFKNNFLEDNIQANRTIEPYSASDLNLEAFIGVNVDVVNADVDIVKGSSYGIEIYYEDARYNPTYKVKGGVLDVEDDPIPTVRNFWQLFNFGENGLSLKRGEITIYLPEGEYDTICIVDVNGHVNVSDTVLDELTMDCVNSSINVKNVKVKDATLSSVNGKISGEQLTSGGLSISCVNGEIELDGTFTGRTKLDTVNGTIDIETTLAQENYDLDLSTVTGKVYLDGDNLKKGIEQDNDAANSLKAETVNGRIEVNFG